MAFGPEIPFLGVKIGTFQGAVAGGIVAALLDRDVSLRRRVVKGLVGTLTAMYATTLIEFATYRFIEIPPSVDKGISFVLGLIGMQVCGAIMIAASRAKNRTTDVVDRVIDTKLGGGNPPA